MRAENDGRWESGGEAEISQIPGLHEQDWTAQKGSEYSHLCLCPLTLKKEPPFLS